MAYAFDQINSVLGQQAAGQSGNTGIFGSGGSADTSQQGQTDQGQAGSGEAPKTSTEGELSAGSSGSSTAQSPKQASVQTSGQAILDKAKQANLDTGIGDRLVGDVKKGETQLQNEANAYTTAQGAKAPKALASGDVESALGGDSGQYGKVENLLRGPGARADQFQSGVGTQYQDIDQIGSQGGLQSYLKKRGNENYTEGQAALDSLLFSRDKNFQQGVQNAKAERQNLVKQQQDAEQNLQGQAQGNIDTAQAAAKQQALDYINSQKTNFQTNTAAKIAAEDARRKEVESNFGNYIGASSTEALNDLYARNAGDKAYIDQARNTVTANPYMQDNFRLSGADDVLNQGDASRFNNILNLLGQGGNLQVNSQPHQDYNFNRAGYQQALMNEVNRLKAVPKPSGGSGGGYVPASSGANPLNIPHDISRGFEKAAGVDRDDPQGVTHAIEKKRKQVLGF